MLTPRAQRICLLIVVGSILGIAYTMTQFWVKAENEKDQLATNIVEMQLAMTSKVQPSTVDASSIPPPAPANDEPEITRSEAHELVGPNGEKSRLVEVWRGESRYTLYLETESEREELISKQNDAAGFKTTFETKGKYSLLTLWSLFDETVNNGPERIGLRYFFGFNGNKLIFTAGKGNVGADLVMNVDHGNVKNEPISLVLEGGCDKDGMISFLGIQAVRTFYRNPGKERVACDFGYGESYYEPVIGKVTWEEGKVIAALPGGQYASFDPLTPYDLAFIAKR